MNLETTWAEIIGRVPPKGGSGVPVGPNQRIMKHTQEQEIAQPQFSLGTAGIATLEPTKWEHSILDIRGEGSRLFHEVGERGWELVTVVGDRAYFKRPLLRV
jgi:hypothetical protein